MTPSCCGQQVTDFIFLLIYTQTCGGHGTRPKVRYPRSPGCQSQGKGRGCRVEKTNKIQIQRAIHPAKNKLPLCTRDALLDKKRKKLKPVTQSVVMVAVINQRVSATHSLYHWNITEWSKTDEIAVLTFSLSEINFLRYWPCNKRNRQCKIFLQH